jgi:ComF family protein
MFCQNCLEDKPPFNMARAAFPYKDTFRKNLLNFKYNGEVWLRRPLAAILVSLIRQQYNDIAFDVIIPIPLAANRLAERGYNQVELCTKILSRELGISHMPELLKRNKETLPLAALPKEERKRELKYAFLADRDVASKKILLVDDIYTTGATVSQATQTLQEAGALGVWVAALAASIE